MHGIGNSALLGIQIAIRMSRRMRKHIMKRMIPLYERNIGMTFVSSHTHSAMLHTDATKLAAQKKSTTDYLFRHVMLPSSRILALLL